MGQALVFAATVGAKRQRNAVTDLRHVTIYTDGACTGNPGPGGYDTVLLFGDGRKELSGGYKRTTNNRMEILAVIVGLDALKERCRVTLYSDSRYVVDAMSRGWAVKWRARGWMRNKTDAALNPDLWERLLDLCEKQEVTFQWVRGHNGVAENERADRLATSAARAPALPVDEGFESS